MSSMCPTIVMDNEGKVRFITGGSGGTRITTATSYVKTLLYQQQNLLCDRLNY